MASSANTFGTFLQTLDSLEKQSASSDVRAGPSRIANLIQEIARNGNRSPLKDLVEASDLSKEELLSTVMDGTRQGLIDISDEQGAPIARLTSLGKLFTP